LWREGWRSARSEELFKRAGRLVAAMEAGEVFGDNEDGEGDDEDDAEEVW